MDHLIRVAIAGVAVAFVMTASTPARAEGDVNGLGDESRFGIDYVFPLDPLYQSRTFAEDLAATGAGWVNFANVAWNKIEPRASRNGQYRYQWDTLDRAVRHWQQHGFQIVMTLRMGKGWFSGPVTLVFEEGELPLLLRPMVHNADRLPKEGAMAAFEAWVAAIVERYDGDGKDDMPGLARPVLHYQVGNEVGNPAFWTGTIDEYFVLLDAAREAARAANPEVRIIPTGLRPNDFFTRNPNGEDPEPYLEDFLDRLEPLYRKGILRNLELDERVATAAGRYDILDAGGNGSWHRTTPGFYRWLDRTMTAAENAAEVWDLESRTEPILTAVETTHAYLDLEVPKGQMVLHLMRSKRSPRHREAVAWYRREQACLLTKVYATRFAAGAEKVFVGMPMDWDKGLEALAWPNPYMGLMSQRSEPWPAAHALAFLVDQLDGFKTATRIDGPDDVHLYRFEFGATRPPVWIVWLDEESVRGLDDPLPRRTVTLDQIPSASRAFEIPTSGRDPMAIDLSQPDGPLRLAISPIPIVIRQ